MLTRNNIEEYFDRMNDLRVLIIGDVMLDTYIWGRVDRISPEAPVPVVTVRKRANLLGGAANVALNIKAMGATAVLCSVIGNDQKGDNFIELLKKEELTAEGIIRNPRRITTTKFRVIGNNYHLIRVDEEMDSDLNQEETKDLLERFKMLTRKCKFDVIILQDYNKGVLTGKVIRKITDEANHMGIPVTVDPKKKNFNTYKNVSLFKPNLKELNDGNKTDVHPDNHAEFESVVHHFQREQNIQNLLVTLSERGVFISSMNKQGHTLSHQIPAHVRSISDVSGAGDTVIGIASLCLAVELPAYDIAYIANLAGGLVCEHVGVVPVKKEELLKEVMKNNALK